jgi:hypothetical protein
MRYAFIVIALLCVTAPSATAQQTDDLWKKLSPSLQELQRNSRSAGDEKFNITLATNNIDSVLAFCSQLKITVAYKHPPSGTIIIQCSKSQLLTSLIKHRNIIFIDEQPIAKEEAAIKFFDISVSGIRKAHATWPTLNGKGMMVSVKENLPDTGDIDFSGRYVALPFAANEYTNTHATDMASIIAGGGNTNYTSKGVAWASGISSASFNPVLPEADDNYKQNNISVQNHSYGTSVQAYYGAEAFAFDKSVNNNAQLLHVFSIGNRGMDAGKGLYAGVPKFSNLTGNFKMAKNILTVGALDRFGMPEELSSRGPAYDGRIKPELVTLGEDGSSGAAAMVSGAAVLVQQQYQRQKRSLPSTALVKSVLINSATDVAAKGPDFITGYGSLNLFKAIQTVVQNRFFESDVVNKETRSFSITVPAAAAQLKVTLCWNDPAAAVNSSKALVNDLDMELTQLGTANKWQPWVLSSFPTVDSLNLPAKRNKDTINNIEQITIDNPAAGVFQCKVTGSFITSGTQSFSVAYEIDTLNRFTWLFPVKGENLQSNNKNMIRWTSSFSAPQKGALEALIGGRWISINNNITITSGNYQWEVPNYLEAASQLRMNINTQRFASDNFTISKMSNATTGFICADSFMLYWNRIPGVTRYQLYRMGEQYLEPGPIVRDTLIVLKENAAELPYYSVAPLLGGTVAGEKSTIINYTTQGVDCYVQSFLADGENGKAALRLYLGTNYRLREITFEKLLSGGIVPLKVDKTIGNTDFEYIDSLLQRGENKYRAKITLVNGQVLYTDTRIVTGFGIFNQLVYPTLLSPGQQLTVLLQNANSNYKLQLVDVLGKLVMQKDLVMQKEIIPVRILQKGIYFYSIYNNGRREQSGKIVIQ